MLKQQIILALSVSVLLGGCTLRGHGEFTCPDAEQGVCTDGHTAFLLAEQGKTAKDFANKHVGHSSTSDEDNHSHDSEHENDEHNHHENEAKHHGSMGSMNVPNQPSSSSYAANQYRDVAPIAGAMRVPVDQPKPILKQATVLEVWISAWEDEDKVLHMPQTSYVEITPRRWSITDTAVNEYRTQGPFVEVNDQPVQTIAQ